MNGELWVFDGIAGSGKSTMLRAKADALRKEGRRVFELATWEMTESHSPRFEEVRDHDVFFTYEPTRRWIGAAIRHELSRDDSKAYDGKTVAQAFAADRFVAYRRLIVPALEAGKLVMQDRGVSTSIVCQPIMPSGYPLEEILALPGNAFALRYAPKHLVITHLPPEMAVARQKARDDESRGVFSDLGFLKRVQERFLSDWFRTLFEHCGTTVHLLDTSADLETVKKQAAELLLRLT